MEIQDYSTAAALLALQGEFEAIKNMPAPMPFRERGRYSVKDLKAGSLMELSGHVYLVEEKNEYREGKWRWHELCLAPVLGGDIVFLNWDNSDKVKASIWETDRVMFAELGLNAADLNRFKNLGSGVFRFHGKTYQFQESAEAAWYQNCGDEAVPFEYFDFRAAETRERLCVESWEGASFEVAVGYDIDPRKIQVLAL